MITVSNLTKSYRRRTVVDDLSFERTAGRITAFGGPNGAGTEKPNRSRPIGDQRAVPAVSTAATTKRLRMSRTMSSIDIPLWPPCPIISCAECATGAPVVDAAG